MWLGSHYALLSGTGLASIIVVAKARGTGKKSVPRSVLEKKEDKERKKKGKGKKKHKILLLVLRVFFPALLVAHPMSWKILAHLILPSR